ncbi:MAG: CheY-like response regulator receiver domain protein [Verrucomicrobiales bacterium]|nr:CheY-like response regulator receiver domain protein [Verrucomicrobiales bacterium]
MDKSAEKLILIIDDQESDQQVLARSLRRLGVLNPVHRLGDGHEAMRYLNGDTPYGDRTTFPFPAIIFLDLNLPLVNGWEVLDWVHGLSLKGASELFVYSEVKNVNEVRRIYDLGADSFLRKPVNELDLMNLIYHFPKHWNIQREKTQS